MQPTRHSKAEYTLSAHAQAPSFYVWVTEQQSTEQRWERSPVFLASFYLKNTLNMDF